MLHYLRITVTALSLTACLLFIGLWVRSYWWQDYFRGWATGSRTVGSLSWCGWIMLTTEWYNLTAMTDIDASELPRWEASYVYVDDPIPLTAPLPKWSWAFHSRRRGSEAQLVIPFWLTVILTAIIAAVPWLPFLHRFSLRTLLIVTTLVAVVLGIVVAVSR